MIQIIYIPVIVAAIILGILSGWVMAYINCLSDKTFDIENITSFYDESSSSNPSLQLSNDNVTSDSFFDFRRIPTATYDPNGSRFMDLSDDEEDKHMLKVRNQMYNDFYKSLTDTRAEQTYVIDVADDDSQGYIRSSLFDSSSGYASDVSSCTESEEDSSTHTSELI